MAYSRDPSEPKRGAPRRLTRRGFVVSAGAVSVLGSGMLRPLSAFASEIPRAGDVGELRATDPGGIDLHLEHRDLLIGGQPGRAIAINGSIPGPVIRMREGGEALIRVHNHLPESTSIHWHGILLPFTMDGVPGISFPGIPSGETFTYRYPVRQNGTYWYHSHTGLQEQLGHYGQLILEPADTDPVDFDVEHSVVLSDWTFEHPHRVLWKLKTMEGYYNFQRPTLANINDQMKATGMSFGEVVGKRLAWDRMRMDPTDIADITGATYTYLMNGQAADENPTFLATPGQRVRLRIANASTMTFYDVRIPGLPMTVVQADGQNIRPVETDELRIAVAETYDVVVTIPDNRAYTVFAETMDRSGYARGTLAPKSGMSAEIPAQRRRPMLTMADMGMMMHGAMDGMNGGGMHGAMSSHDASHEGMRMRDRSLMFVLVVMMALVHPAAAQEKSEPPSTADRPDHSESAKKHADASAPEVEDPPIPEGMTLDELLARAASPTPAGWPDVIPDDRRYLFTYVEQLEWRMADDDADDHLGWEAQGWYGGDIHKFWWKQEGEAIFAGSDRGESETDLLYSWLVTPFWNVQAGVQYANEWHDGYEDRWSGVIALQGLLPYKFEVDSSLFVSEDGDVTAELEAEYDLRITQRLVAQPRLGTSIAFGDIPDRGLASGVTDLTLDLRLRYEIRREFAPYLGVRYGTLLGDTEDMAEAAGDEAEHPLYLAGLRFAF